MKPARQGEAGGDVRRIDPKHARLLLPAIMATVMSFVMSLVETIARLGFAPDLVPAWLASFAIGVVVAAPTAVLVAPAAQRLVGCLTGSARTRRTHEKE
jgi:integral membrane sensor domain MASE1